jgi:hypothetical protein
VKKHGLWDQITVDYGREWYLMLFINQTVAHLRTDTTKDSYRQTSSTKVKLDIFAYVKKVNRIIL